MGIILPQKQLRLLAFVPDAHGDIHIQVKKLLVVIGSPAAVVGHRGVVVFQLVDHEIHHPLADAQPAGYFFGCARGFVSDEFVEAVEALEIFYCFHRFKFLWSLL